MSKYKLTEEDNTFFEDDYHDMHTTDWIDNLISFMIGLLFGYWVITIT